MQQGIKWLHRSEKIKSKNYSHLCKWSLYNGCVRVLEQGKVLCRDQHPDSLVDEAGWPSCGAYRIQDLLPEGRRLKRECEVVKSHQWYRWLYDSGRCEKCPKEGRGHQWSCWLQQRIPVEAAHHGWWDLCSLVKEVEASWAFLATAAELVVIESYSEMWTPWNLVLLTVSTAAPLMVSVLLKSTTFPGNPLIYSPVPIAYLWSNYRLVSKGLPNLLSVFYTEDQTAVPTPLDSFLQFIDEAIVIKL